MGACAQLITKVKMGTWRTMRLAQCIGRLGVGSRPHGPLAPSPRPGGSPRRGGVWPFTAELKSGHNLSNHRLLAVPAPGAASGAAGVAASDS
jgi:hypothetical protein